MQHGDKCIEFMADLNIKRLRDLSLIRQTRCYASVVRNSDPIPSISHSFRSIMEKLKALGLSSHIVDFKSLLKFCPPQGWEDDLGKISLYRFSRLRDVNQPKVLTERGNLIIAPFLLDF